VQTEIFVKFLNGSEMVNHDAEIS